MTKNKMKPCPFHNCLTCACFDWLAFTTEDWNKRPIEDSLNSSINQLIDIGNKMSYIVHDTQYIKLAKQWEDLVNKIERNSNGK